MYEEVVCIIPARFNAKRLPGKPLRTILGKPLIQYVWERVRRAKSVDRIIIATDTLKVKNVCEKFGAEAILTSTDCLSGSDRVAQVAKKFKPEIIINVQCDEPLIPISVIDRLIMELKKNKNLKYVTAAYPIKEKSLLQDPNIVKVVIDKNNYALYFSRAPIPYNRDNNRRVFALKHLGIYGYRYDSLMKFANMERSNLEKIEKLEQLRILENGYKIKVVISKYDSISVDTEEDLKKVNKILTEGKR
jgi:3-deoxy-manno-octulosonate cytidylyltransferase (CMP-KDO synthetase)